MLFHIYLSSMCCIFPCGYLDLWLKGFLLELEMEISVLVKTKLHIKLKLISFKIAYIVMLWTKRKYVKLLFQTRMHSSRMRTARAFTVCRSLLLGGCTWSWGVYLPGPGEGGGTPPCGQNSWHTLLKLLPCPKPRLRAVITFKGKSMFQAFELHAETNPHHDDYLWISSTIMCGIYLFFISEKILKIITKPKQVRSSLRIFFHVHQYLFKVINTRY